jgi:hypothetical protein
VAAVGAVALLSGCGEDSVQHAARLAADRYARAHGYPDERTHCTSTGKIVIQPIATTTYLCIVRRRDDGCDELRAVRRGRGFDVSLSRRRVDCVLLEP